MYHLPPNDTNEHYYAMFHKQAQARIDIKDFRPDKQMQ